MKLDGASRSIPTPVVIGVLVVAVAAGAAYLVWDTASTKPLKVDYPYWCSECKAVFDKSEITEWKQHLEGGSDSVVVCIKCGKGKAYPVIKCPKCGKSRVLHVWKGDARCPFCHPEIMEAAKAQGVELVPPEIRD